MKKLFAAWLIIGFYFILTSQNAAAQGMTDSAYIRENFTKREVLIPMRDGIKLFTAIYTPKNTSKKYPILLNRTPYTVAPYGEDKFKTSFMNMSLARGGYIFVYQDVRGKWMSEGDFVDVRPIVVNRATKNDIDESTDTYDTVDWLVKNVANNAERVGVYGISYPGFYATNALVEAHPSVKAVSPQAPVTDWFIGDDFHHNGALMLMDGFSFYLNFGRPRPKPIQKLGAYVDAKIVDNYDFYLKMGALPNYTKKYMGDSIRFWTDLMAHPNYDAFWKARNIRPHLKNTKPAVLTVGGLFDAEDCFGAWRTYEALEKQNDPSVSNRIVMGPWFHGAWGGRSDGGHLGNIAFGSKTSEFYQKEIEARFFNFYLKDEGAMDLAEANVFETGSNRWTTYETWPPKSAKPKNLFLQTNGKLTFTPPTSPTGLSEWISDPAHPVPYTEDVHANRTREYMTDDQRFAARRPDVLTFQTDVLTEDLTLTGAIDAALQFSTSGTDADVVVKIIDVFPDTTAQNEFSKVPMGGYEMLVRGEILRGRFRNSFEKPAPFVANQITEVKYQLPDVAHCFRKGHRLMVQIQSSWFPLADLNPQKFVDIYTAQDADFQKATHRIYHNAAKASYLKLLVLEK